jgi:hypothetical protein
MAYPAWSIETHIDVINRPKPDPHGIATLVYGLLADGLGIHRVMFASLAASALLTALTAICCYEFLCRRHGTEVIPYAMVTGLLPIDIPRSREQAHGHGPIASEYQRNQLPNPQH